ncbi:glycosyltransferase family 4 protein [Patescibacteria group bacterium]
MSTNNSNSIILLSALDIWSMGEKKGAQSLYRTLIGLADIAHVYYITSNKKHFDDRIHENITTIRFDVPWLQKTFYPTSSFNFLMPVLFPLWWIIFQMVSFFIVMRLLSKEKSSVKLLYAYESMATPVMKLISLIKKKKLVSRFMGTIYYPKLSQPFSWLTHFYYYIPLKTKADILIMANDGTRGDKVLKALKNRTKEIHFWRNGVDLPQVPDTINLGSLVSSLGIPDGSHILLTISRLVGWKRLDRAINALHRLQDSQVHLVIVGDGDKKEDLHNLSRQLNLEKNIHFLGAVSQQDLGQYYAIADIFLSLYDLSNVGNPLLEAMSFGKTIITLNNGDTGKCIQHMQTGILIEPANETEIEKYINQLLHDKELRMKLGSSAKEFAKENFWTWHQRIEEEKKVILRLINK